MTDELVGAILSGWAGRWKHPELAVELMRREHRVDLTHAAALLVEGLARPRTVAESVDALITDGRFDAAELLLLNLLDDTSADGGSDDGWRAAADRLAAARADGVAELRRQWVDLQNRAVGVGLPPADEPALGSAAHRSLHDGQELVDREAERVGRAERTRVAEAEEQLAGCLGALGASERTGRWADSVKECLRAGEFHVAEELLRAGPDGSIDVGPRTVAPPPLRWPWLDRPAAEILGWYSATVPAPGPEFERYRPLVEGEAWPQMLALLLRLEEEGVNGVTVRDLAVALAGLLGEQAAPPVETVGGQGTGTVVGFHTRLFGLHDPRMPVLPLLRHEGVTLWLSVGDDGGTAVAGPPPGEGPVVWFRFCTHAARSTEPHVAVLDLADLLLIAAPDGSRRATGPTTRRINLLRILVPQLAAEVVMPGPALDLGGGASPRDSLAWLFDLFGLRPDRPVLDGILHDTSGNRIALHCLLHTLLSAVLDGGGARVELEALRAARGPELRLRTRDALLAPLASDGPARAVLWLVLWQDDSEGKGLDPARVLAALDLIDVPPDVRQRVAAHLPVMRAFATLTTLGLLQVEDDSVVAPPPGLRRILCGDDNLRAVATAAVEEAAESLRASDRATAAVLGERITQTIGHRVDNDVISIRRALADLAARTADPAARADLDAVAARVQGLGSGSYVSAYEDALRPPRPVDVGDIVRSLVGEVEFELSNGISIRPGGVESVHVVANDWVLREALRNLVRNAEAALRHAVVRAIQIVVIHHVGPPGAPALPLPLPCVAIEVTDGGPGFAVGELDRYRSLIGLVPPPNPGMGLDPVARRTGTGLLQTQTWLRDYGGTLELSGQPADLGGACVRIWLPTVQAPRPGGSP